MFECCKRCCHGSKYGMDDVTQASCSTSMVQTVKRSPNGTDHRTKQVSEAKFTKQPTLVGVRAKHLNVPDVMICMKVNVETSSDAIWSDQARDVYYDMPMHDDDDGAKQRLEYLKQIDKTSYQNTASSCHTPPSLCE